jgi:hypothetical protein
MTTTPHVIHLGLRARPARRALPTVSTATAVNVCTTTFITSRPHHSHRPQLMPTTTVHVTTAAAAAAVGVQLPASLSIARTVNARVHADGTATGWRPQRPAAGRRQAARPARAAHR